MKRQITLNDVRKWTGEKDLTMEFVSRFVADLHRDTQFPLGQINRLSAAILQHAPCECVQVFRDEGWQCTNLGPKCRVRGTTYRLHPDCELVDDDEWDFLEAYNADGLWLYTGGERITDAPARCRYICIQVTDAEGREWFVANWRGPYGGYLLYDRVEDLVQDTSTYTTAHTDRMPLTPKAVVFRKETK